MYVVFKVEKYLLEDLIDIFFFEWIFIKNSFKLILILWLIFFKYDFSYLKFKIKYLWWFIFILKYKVLYLIGMLWKLWIYLFNFIIYI